MSRNSMVTVRPHVSCMLWVLAAGLLCVSAHAVTVTLGTSHDVTIYDSGGDLSNGAGPHCFVGKNGTGAIRRALLRFNVASIPPGSTITAVTLTLNMSMSITDATNVTAHRVTASWGEGTSLPPNNGGDGIKATPNDATWTHRFYSTTLWTTQGGQFAAAASATTSVNANGLYNWTSATMIANVQQWVNTPSSNFGWILRGDEVSSASTKRFDTKENTSTSLRPKLVITYTLPCTPDANQEHTVNVLDMLAVINAWGACANPNNCPADIAPPGPPVGDDIVNVADLLAVINGWGACP